MIRTSTSASTLLTTAAVTRRHVLGGGAALAGLAMAGTMPAPARAQTRGGTIRVAKGHGQTTDTLDPGTWDNGFVVAMAYGLHGFLTGFATDGTLEPQIAERWEASPDARVWRFTIRSDARFHDGRTVTPDHVVASIQYHRGEQSTSGAKPILEGITEISVDGQTVVFTLSEGNADFPAVFTDYHLVVLPEGDDRGVDWRSGIGCGPYQLVEFQPGVVLRLERFAEDWDQGRGFFEGIEMLSVIDLNARTTALISGDVHVIDKLDLKTVGLMARNPDLTIHSVAGNQHYSFPMNCTTDPYTNLDLRLALKHGIDRQELVDKILFGYGSVGNDHPIGRGQRFYHAELEQTPYDPDRARFHLQQAGLEGVKLTLSAADAAFPGAVDAAVLYSESAARAGIDIEVKRVPNDGYWSDVWLQAPFCAAYWGGRPTEDAMFTTAYASGAAWNDTYWENARFNELLVTARAELDEARRREMYFEMQQIVSQDGGAVIPMFANYVFATRPDIVTSEAFSSHWDMDGERWMERWSFV